MQVDVNKLTLGEVDTIETLSGLAIDQLQAPGVPKGKMYAAVVFVMKKRHDPHFKFEDALNIDISELTDMFTTSDNDGDEDEAVKN